jgi:hypothetical protein
VITDLNLEPLQNCHTTSTVSVIYYYDTRRESRYWIYRMLYLIVIRYDITTPWLENSVSTIYRDLSHDVALIRGTTFARCSEAVPAVRRSGRALTGHCGPELLDPSPHPGARCGPIAGPSADLQSAERLQQAGKHALPGMPGTAVRDRCGSAAPMPTTLTADQPSRRR